MFAALLLLAALLPREGPDKFNIKVTRLSDQFFVHTSFKRLEAGPYPSNGLLVDTDSGVVLVDTPWDTTQTLQLLTWIETHLRKQVVLCIVSHAHEDRMGGAAVLQRRGVRIVATELTARRAVERGLERVEGILPEDTTFTVGRTVVECFFPGKGHTDDNIVVWFPRQEVLFGGCLVKSVDVSGMGYVADASLDDWGETLHHVMKKCPSARIVIPGHEGWGSNHAMEHTLELLKKNGH